MKSVLLDAAFDAVVSNLRAALRTSLVPFAVALVVFVLLNVGTLRALWAQGGGRVDIDRSETILLFIGFLAFVVAFFSAAVRWHQFSLGLTKSDRPGMKAPLLYGAIFVFLGVILILGLSAISFVVVVACECVVSIHIGRYEEVLQKGWGWVLFNGVLTWAFAYAFLRLSPWLVVTAAWYPAVRSLARTRPIRGEIARIALIYTVATFLWTLLGTVSAPSMVVVLVMLAVRLVIVWIAFMMSFAILTEIYKATEPPNQTPQAA